MSSQIPLNSLLRHTSVLQADLIRASQEVIRSGYYVLGPQVEAFETEFARYCGTDHCIGVANGTDALELSLKALGVSAGDKVAVVANAAMYSTSAVLAAGAIPVFIDIADDSTMDPGALRSAAAANTLSAVVVTHLYGRLADMAGILGVADAFNIPVVEDCAQAHGARDEGGRAAGSLGALGSFSFYPTKNLGALGDGGAVTTSDPQLAQRVRQLRQYGWGQKYDNEIPGGRNSRLDELQAAMLRVMLPRLDAWNARRREIGNRYSTSIRHPDIAVPPPGGAEYVAHLYVVRSPRREELREHLAELGIATEVHYPLSDHQQPSLEGKYVDASLERTVRDTALVLSLPCFPELTGDEVDQVVDACNRF